MKLKSILGVCTIAALLLAACGSDDDTASNSTSASSAPAPNSTSAPSAPASSATAPAESSGSSEVSQPSDELTAFSDIVAGGTAKVVAWSGPTQAVAAEADKLLVSIPCASAAITCQRTAEAAMEAAEAIGWKAQVIDGQGTPDGQSAAIQQAVTLGADAVVLVGVDPAGVGGAITEARKADVIVVSNWTDAETNATGDGLQADVLARSEDAGRLIAAQAVLDTNGGAKVALFTADEFGVVRNRFAGVKEVLDQCGGCEIVAEENFTIASIQDLPTLTSSVLQAHPEINVIITGFDGAVLSQVPVLQQYTTSCGSEIALFYSLNAHWPARDCCEADVIQATSRSTTKTCCFARISATHDVATTLPAGRRWLRLR